MRAPRHCIINARQAHPAMIRTIRRWPLMLALRPWYDDPVQAVAMLMVAGVTYSGRPLRTVQARDHSIHLNFQALAA